MLSSVRTTLRRDSILPIPDTQRQMRQRLRVLKSLTSRLTSAAFLALDSRCTG